MNFIFEKGKVPSNFRKALIKNRYKKGEKGVCCNYRVISMASVESKLHSMMIFYRLRDAANEVLIGKSVIIII